MPMKKLPTNITLADDVLFKELQGEAVLLHLGSESYYGLDDVGTRMWQLLNEQHDMDDVVKKLLAEYDVEEASLRSDLAQLINQLADAGLIQVSV